MGRKIRLTETQFRNMIARIVKETKHEYDEEIIEDDFEEYFGDDFESEDIDSQKMDDVETLAQYFADEVLPNLPKRILNKIEDRVEDLDAEEILSESEEEEYSPIERRKDLRKGRALQAGAAAVGFPAGLGFLAQIPGYIDFPNTLLKVHELFEKLNLGNYTGPVMTAMIGAAIIMAIKGQMYKDEARSGKKF